jgi:hypothetical protein
MLQPAMNSVMEIESNNQAPVEHTPLRLLCLVNIEHLCYLWLFERSEIDDPMAMSSTAIRANGKLRYRRSLSAGRRAR